MEMISPKIQSDDPKRVEILEKYRIMDTLNEDEYDHVASLAASICNTDVALVTFINAKRQWFKAHHGTKLKENTRELALCSHAINDPQNITHVPDTTKDMRFKFNPMVTGPTHVNFYAGVPILSPEGYALGTVCVMDSDTKKLTRTQLEALILLKDLVQKMLELRRQGIRKKSP